MKKWHNLQENTAVTQSQTASLKFKNLDNISEVMENDHKVVLVECVNIVSKGDNVEQESIYRWFKVPNDWTKEYIIKN